MIGGIGNSVFHPADFALLNASVNQNRLGRAFSIHGVGGSLGWAAAPVMYFLDSMFGWVGAALIGAMPGLVLSVLVWAHRTELVDHRIKHRADNPGGGGDPGAFYAAGDPFVSRLLRTDRRQHRGHSAVCRSCRVNMFGISENYAALCLIVFIVGSASGVLVGGLFADRVHRHDRVAMVGLLVAAALTLPIATRAVIRNCCCRSSPWPARPAA